MLSARLGSRVYVFGLLTPPITNKDHSLRVLFETMTSAWGENPEEAADSADEDGSADDDPYAGEPDNGAPESAVPAASSEHSEPRPAETIASLSWQIDILMSPGFKKVSLKQAV